MANEEEEEEEQSEIRYRWMVADKTVQSEVVSRRNEWLNSRVQQERDKEAKERIPEVNLEIIINSKERAFSRFFFCLRLLRLLMAVQDKC